LDWCDEDSYPSQAVTDPKGAADGTNRVRRSGSWGNNAYYCRSAFRYWTSPPYRSDFLGFRLASSADGTAPPPPDAADDAYATLVNKPLDVAAPGVLANDTAQMGGVLTAVKVSGPTRGALVLNADGSFTYTPRAGFVGVDSFTYKASEGQAESEPVTVTITVIGEAGDYLVIDLSGGSSAASYPVSYRSVPPAGGWTDEYKTTKLVLRRIPAGSFMMGSPKDELGRWDDETLHRVTLSKDFYVGVFEVTQKQWERVMGTWPSVFKNASYRNARPVEQVSYDDIRGSGAGSKWPATNAVDAGSFLGRLRTKTGLDFDLPTEAQWEYACRAGTTTALNSGKNLTDIYNCPNMAEVGRYWYNGGKDYSTGGDTSRGTAKVGSYKPNRWGLYDMHGNVYEWCLDWFQPTLGSSVQTDPRGAASGTDRARRGGSWGFSAGRWRSANRDGGNPPSGRYGDLGFRLVWMVP
jgi:formylglycine-generating enzyme required for sulfatase activity